MKRTVNDKGSLGVSKVIADLLAKGYYVFLPFDGSSPVDLIVADASMNMKRLQIKYRAPNQSSTLIISLDSVVNGKRIPIDLCKIDGWAVYSPANDTVYYIAKHQVRNGDKNFSLSLLAKLSTSNKATNYLDASIFWSVG